jgi:hypothetical protein
MKARAATPQRPAETNQDLLLDFRVTFTLIRLKPPDKNCKRKSRRRRKVCRNNRFLIREGRV